MARLNEKTLRKLWKTFDTMELLDAATALDEIRAQVADEENFRPPKVRDELLR